MFSGAAVEGGVEARAELVALRFPHPERLAPALAAAGGVEAVEAWAIALADGGGALQADLASARTRHDRGLVTRTGTVVLPGAGPWTARARVVDAAGGETWHRWRLTWADGALGAEPCG